MARLPLALPCVAAVALGSTVAWAGPRDDALAAIAAEDLKTAKKAIAALDEQLGGKRKLVRPVVLSRRYLTEALYHEARGKQDDVLAALRQACLVHPGSEPDEAIIGDGKMVDMYYAVCSEVEQRPEVDLSKLKLPDAPVRIDGVVPGEVFPVREGRHLVQVECANGKWSTRWSELSRSEDWAAGCPDGALASSEPDEPEDIVDAAIPAFLGGGGDMDDGDMDDGDMSDGDMSDGDMDAEGPDGEAAEDEGGAESAPTPEPVEPAPAEPAATATSEVAETSDGLRLEVACAPAACTVRIDGEKVGTSPFDTTLEPGDYDLSLKAGPNSVTRKLKISADAATTKVDWDNDKAELKVKSSAP